MWKKVALVLAGVVMALLLLELSLRFYVANFGSDEQKTLYLHNREQIEAVGRRFEGSAYLNFRLSPARPDHNTLGYRGAEIIQPKPDDTFRIVALGGSTTYGEFIDDPSATYPAQLQAHLQAALATDAIEVINAGVPAYTTWESLVNLQFRVLDLEPDLIIIYHAVNDIGPRLTHPDVYNSLNAQRGYWRGDDGPIPASSLYRFLLVRAGWSPPVSFKIENQFVQPAGYQDCGLIYQEGRAHCSNYNLDVATIMAANPPTHFERNLRNMALIAQGNNVDVMLVSWAYSPLAFAVPGGDFMTEPYRQSAVTEHNTIIAQLADTLDMAYFDFAEAMPAAAEYWIDGLHVSEAGAQLQASLFAEYMIEADLVQAVN